MKFPAFKEWDAVVRALGSGRQCVILRKGGLHEQNRLFEILHGSFFLFPTQEHQAAEDLNEEGKKNLAASLAGPPVKGKVRIEFEASLERAWRVEDLKKLRDLGAFHTASETGLKKKFEWGDRPGLYVLLVRVFRLGEVLEIPDLPAYGGCRSWVELDLEESVCGRVKSRPVISEDVFLEKTRSVAGVLSGCEEIPRRVSL